jgi:hypothetical protein
VGVGDLEAVEAGGVGGGVRASAPDVDAVVGPQVIGQWHVEEQRVLAVAGRPGDRTRDETPRAARRAREREDELPTGLERLHHPVERAHVEVHPAAPVPIRHADHGGCQDACLGDERAARLGDDLDGVRQGDERIGDRAPERLEPWDRLGVAGGQAAADVEERETQALHARGAHDVAGERDRTRVGARIERLRADVEGEAMWDQPTLPRLDEQRDGRRRIYTELAGERNPARRVRRLETHVHARTRRVCGELLELAARVDSEAVEPELPRTGHVRGWLDRVAVEHAPRIDSERDERLELRQRGDLEARTERVQAGEQRRLGIALHGVVQRDLREGAAKPEVGAFDRLEVEREERARVGKGVERGGRQGLRLGDRERAHARPRSRSS